MSILGDTRIRDAMSLGLIQIRPMADWAVGTNSVDLHLSKHLAVYPAGDLDTLREHVPEHFGIPDDGCLLMPGEIYLGATVEWTSSGPYVPLIEGTSGAGRLGISIHATAGFGEVGFAGHWTLEISVARAVRVYGGEPLCQIVFHTAEGPIETPYGQKKTQNYQNQGRWPVGSRMWRKRRFTG